MKRESIVEKWYEVSKQIITLAEKLPRSHKFTIGDRLVTSALDITDLYIEAFYLPKEKKCAVLHRINIQLEKMRFLLRLGMEKGLYSSRPLREIQERMHEIGKQTGGWIKSLPCADTNSFMGK